MTKVAVGVLGATGAVGQRFVQLLADHPWVEVKELAASDRSAGKAYKDACTWGLATPPPEGGGGGGGQRGGGVRSRGQDLRREVRVQDPLLGPRLLGGGRGGDRAREQGTRRRLEL